jgi:DNA modification methylase
MLVSLNQIQQKSQKFLQDSSLPYLLIEGDASACLQFLPSDCIDMVITSPPYWRKREYANSHSIGGETSIQDYINSLLHVFSEVKRVLKPTGSLWLNLGDTYKNKNLSGIPWRVTIALQDTQGWILRNSVVWNKLKGVPDNADDKLRNIHELVFHLVKQKNYYYDTAPIRNGPKSSSIRNGSVVTATGVSGINYRRQIQRSTALSEEEKANALQALDQTLQKVAAGELFDFRMVIRGQQRATHSSSIKISGRAAELEKKGFYILPYDSRGSKPGDVWEIIPEDQWRKDSHDAPFPEELCMIPIKITCPKGGIVLDPFAGTGTAILAAINLQRRGIGIDISKEYLDVAVSRLDKYQPVLL